MPGVRRGASLNNVTTLWTCQNADFILEACQGSCKCVWIGGGLLGLETAGALARRGADVTVLESQAWLQEKSDAGHILNSMKRMS